MTSYHTIANNLRSNEWTYNKELGVWTNKHGYNVNCTGKIFHEGKEIYFPISRDGNDDLEGRALRFEYAGHAASSSVKTNNWNNYDQQYCHRQKHLTKKRKQKARRRRRECKENEYQQEKEENLKNNNNQ